MGDDMTNNNADSWQDKVSEMSVSGKVVHQRYAFRRYMYPQFANVGKVVPHIVGEVVRYLRT
jgi:hypothetical protein